MNKVINIPRRLPSQLTDRFIDYIRESGDMMIQLELRFKQHIDADRLAKAFKLALDIIPVLRYRFKRRVWKPYWERLSQNPESTYYFTENVHDYDSFKVRSIDAYSGPQVNICLWQTTNEARVLLKVSHLAADAAGVKETARIISSIYSRLKDDPDYHPEPDTVSSRSTRQILAAVPVRYYPSLFFHFFQDNRASRSAQDVLTIPTSGERNNMPKFIEHIIPQDHTAVISEYAHNYGATINDMLLAAFFRALASTQNWDGAKHIKATTTVDLRQYVTRERVSSVANLSIPIWGWPNLKTDLGDNFLSTLNRVSSVTKKRKQNYLGVETLLGMLIILSAIPHSLSTRLISRGIRDKINQGNFAPAFTNMGIIDPGKVIFDEKPIEAHLLPPPVYPPWFMLGISSFEGVISLSAGIYSTQSQYVEYLLKTMDTELPR